MRIVSGVLMAGFLAASVIAARAGDEIGKFNRAAHAEDGQRPYAYDWLDADAPKAAAPVKYSQYLFRGANGAPVERRTEKGFTGGENTAVASAQCDFSLGTLNGPSFGKCPKDRPGERILDKDGSNYNARVMIVHDVLNRGCDIWHTDCGSGQ